MSPIRFHVTPRRGVGPVLLGMHRDEVREAMPGEPESFRKTETCRYETDAFFHNGFQVFYEGDEPRVEFIELSRESGFDASYRDRDVFHTKAAELVEFISQDAPFD